MEGIYELVNLSRQRLRRYSSCQLGFYGGVPTDLHTTQTDQAVRIDDQDQYMDNTLNDVCRWREKYGNNSYSS
ncbi:hypothetical protein O9929_13205 [Vibrio lentus]|nr:hypothetical protein [Vibrio lentus]